MAVILSDTLQAHKHTSACVTPPGSRAHMLEIDFFIKHFCGGELYESQDFVLNILCSVTAARTKSIAVSGDKHIRAKNSLNLHDNIPIAFSVTLRYLDAL